MALVDGLTHLAGQVAATVARLAPRPATITLAPPAARSERQVAADLADLVSAYPDFLSGADGGFLYWREGARLPIRRPHGVRTPDAILDDPDIADIFAWNYPLTPPSAAPAPTGDPGRPRPAALFMRMYGDCRRGEAQARLTDVRWVGGRRIRFSRVNGAAAALQATADDLERLGAAYGKYLWPISGTFNCRAIAGTDQVSMHAFGAAIDLASGYGAYWRWRSERGRLLPDAVIAAFERHGFIWGGRWAHFDTFHFEYRPELIRAARRAADPYRPAASS